MPIECIELADDSAGSSARVLVGFGFNCFSFRVPRHGEARELLWSAPEFDSGRLRASHSGIPVLFPFAGRIPGRTIEYAGQRYELDGMRDPLGNTIHGFVLNRPWRVVRRTPKSVTGEFHAARDDSRLLSQWPADFQIQVTYELQDSTLRSIFEVCNPDRKPLPFALGAHPYFRVPLTDETAANACVVHVPARQYWPLVDGMPSGERLPVDGPRDLRQGQPFGALQLDDVLTDLQSEDGRAVCRIQDSAGDCDLKITFGREFQHAVVFNPPHREAICIEPYTGVPNALALEARGVPAGLLTLGPGESWTAQWELRAESWN